MPEGNSLFYMRKYGKVHVKLKDLLDKHGITRNALARSINTRFEVIDKWYNDEVERIDLDVLARICFVLNCSIADVLEYEREGEAAE